MTAIADQTNAELESLLDSLPQTPEEIITGLDAVAEVMQRVDQFVRTHELSDDELEQLHEQLRELRDAGREFLALLWVHDQLHGHPERSTHDR